MKFWLATANTTEAEELLSLGVFEGIITNPTIVAKEEMNPVKLFKALCSKADSLYYQIGDGTFDAMMGEADRMVSIDPNKMRIKVPATPAGLRVIRALTEQGSIAMATIVPTAPLMLLAVAAGAIAIAPYSRMIQQAGVSSKIEEVLRMQQIIDAQELDVEICTGLYNVTDLSFYAAHGVKSGFIFPNDIRAFIQQPLVQEACDAYRDDLSHIKSFV
ncbi:transaldolase family protein [Sediminispirochaeta bajacaliforniensis]|uniref:transaldolase family protein n=1 Tax=Sediminispirochaeta bajacaliforniensis TaxID=148 RepID=UPI0003710E27|nr:transaldolase family protein [Sediminispirochaeta bajacaliforniensis]